MNNPFHPQRSAHACRGAPVVAAFAALFALPMLYSALTTENMHIGARVAFVAFAGFLAWYAAGRVWAWAAGGEARLSLAQDPVPHGQKVALQFALARDVTGREWSVKVNLIGPQPDGDGIGTVWSEDFVALPSGRHDLSTTIFIPEHVTPTTAGSREAIYVAMLMLKSGRMDWVFHLDTRARGSLSRPVATLLLCFSVLAFTPQNAHSQAKHAEPGSHTLAIAVNGLERTYIVHVPATYSAQTRLPLVIMLHGGGGTARAAIWETEWALKADKEGFLAVFPNAMARDPARSSSFSGNPQLWNDGSDRFYPGQTVVDDVGFIAAMLDDLSARFAVDERRVFLTGFSNGASMSFRVGAQLSDRIAAVAPVAGALWFDPPMLRYPVSLCYITGTADPLNLIEGGVPKLATGASDKVRAKPKPPVRDSILKWVKALGCPATTPSASYARGVRTETYSPCTGDAEVVYIAVDGLGHTWAGGRSLLPESMVGKTSKSISATDVIWDFFQKHVRPLPEKNAAQQDAPADANKARR